MSTNLFQFAPRNFVDSVTERSALLAEFSVADVTAREFAKSRNIPDRTFRRYRRQAVANGRAGLGDRRSLNSGRRPTNIETQAGWACCFLAAFPKAPLTVVHARLLEVCKREGWPTVSYRSFARSMKELPEDLMMRLRCGYKAVFEKTALIPRREDGKLMDRVQFDCTELDLWVLDMTDGTVFRPWASAIIETVSRAVMGVTLHKTPPNREEAMAALRKALLPKKDARHPFWGAPRIAQTDNASIYVYNEIKRAALMAGCAWVQIPKGHSGANGKIERFFGTTNTTFLSSLPGYANRHGGKHVAETRGAIPWPLLESLVDGYVAKYNTTPHSSIGCSPWEMWHSRLDEVEPYRLNARTIDEAFRIPHDVEVTRKGISVGGTWYQDACLVPYFGQTVRVFTRPLVIENTLDVLFDGKEVGRVAFASGSPEVASEINQARSDRQIQLNALARKMREKLSETPPVNPVPTKTREDVKPVSSKKRARKPTKIPKFPRT